MWGFFGSGGGGAGGAPSGAAGGDLGSTYPNPTVVSVADVTTGALPVANGGTGATTVTGSGANTLATSPTLVTPLVNTVSSVPGNDFLGQASTPTVAASSVAGNNSVFRGSDAIAGSSNAGAAAGGNVTLQAGDAKRLTSGNTTGGNVTLLSGVGVGTGVFGNITFNTGGTARWRVDGATGSVLAQTDNTNDIGASGANRPRDLYIGRNEIVTGLVATSAAAPTIASATTIAPTTQIAFISGTVNPISTITAPAPIASGGGQITLIPTGLWVTGTAGNIALGTTAVVNKALIMTFDTTTAKWYPSY